MGVKDLAIQVLPGVFRRLGVLGAKGEELAGFRRR